MPFLIIPLLLLLFFLILRLLAAKPKDKAKKIQIPGPWKLPVIGNLHQLAALTRSSSSSSSSSSLLPHHALHELSLKYGPLMHLQLGEVPTVIASSADMAKEIMKTHDLAFVERPRPCSAKFLSYGLTDIAFAPYGDYWRQMRKICTLELLSVKKVRSFSRIRQDEVSKLIESIQSSEGSVFDLTSKIYCLTSSILMRIAFGNTCKGEVLVQVLHEVLKQLDGFHFADLFPSMKLLHLMTGVEARLWKIHEKIDKVLENIIQENLKKLQHMKAAAAAEEEENLVQVLLRIQRGESRFDVPITINNVKAVIWDMFGGGTDTTASLLEWAMSEMMKNPRVMKKAQNEVRNAFKGRKLIDDNSHEMTQLSYLKSVIKETFRLHPPVPLLLPRECKEACQIKGYEIPIKTQVTINAWALGRDPKYWYDAERFMPERFQEGNANSDTDFRGTSFEFIPFGAGRRMCPGISFGLASIELPLASLLYHFDWELPNGMKPQDLDMTETLGVTARRKRNLCLIPTPYKN